MSQQLVFRDIHLSWLLPSTNSMSTNVLAQMSGCDPLSERGQLCISPAMLDNAAANATITVKINSILECSNGSMYMFGNSGKIYRSATGASWSLAHTAAPAAGGSDILCAAEFEGYLYYATESRLGRWQIGTAWAGANDNWQTFANTDAFAHPMIVKFKGLYIGDGRSIHLVDDAGVYSADALRIAASQKIVCFADMERHIVIGTRAGAISDPKGQAKVYVWDTYSVIVTSESLMREPIVSAMGNLDGTILIFAGFTGRIYVMSGYTPKLFTRIPHTWSTSPVNQKYLVNQGSITYRGNTLFFAPRQFTAGLGTLPLGVYALGQATSSDPIVLFQPFMPIEEVSQNISACFASNDIQFTVATYGGSKYIYSTNESSGTGSVTKESDFVIRTPRITVQRDVQHTISVQIAYSSLSDLWSPYVNIEYTTSLDGTTSEGITLVNDTQRKILYSDNVVTGICDFQVVIGTSGSSTASPFNIDAIYITID